MRTTLSNRDALFRQIQRQQSFLCVGLDPDVDRMPEGLPANAQGVKMFLMEVVKATLPYSIAYKPNFAFFEALGPEGMQVLQEVLHSIPNDYLIIGDAKRGDIGNTAQRYAEAVFNTYGCDAITVSPYMGMDTLEPFLSFSEKWTIVLALTSNPGSDDFQRKMIQDGPPLWEYILAECAQKGHPDQTMFVVGGTHAQDFKRVRTIAPDHFLLVPGFGAQQGSLEDVVHHGFNTECGLIANVSRGILYASSGSDYAEAAARVARQYQQEMQHYLETHQLLGA